MKPVLITIEPYDPAISARRLFRLGSGDNPEAYGIGGENWLAAIARRPTFTMDLFDPALKPGISVGQARFDISLPMLGLSLTSRLKWKGAPVKIWLAGDYAMPAEPYFTGMVTSPQITEETQVMTVQASGRDDYLDKPLTPIEYLGSGGAEGDESQRGKPKPIGYGYCENVPINWIDTTWWIGQIDGYGNLSSVDKLMEGLADMGPRQANYGSYAALQTAIQGSAVDPGEWATCTAEGLIGLGAPPAGVMTCHATFLGSTLSEIMLDMMRNQADIDDANIDLDAFSDFDTAVPQSARFWTSGSMDVGQAIGALADTGNARVFVDFSNKISITRLVRSAPVAEVDLASRTAPRVTDVLYREREAPVWKMTGRTARPASTINIQDVRTSFAIVDRGTYSGSDTYVVGNLVTGSDGAKYMYINDTPSSGHAPPNATYWAQISPAPGAVSDMVFRRAASRPATPSNSSGVPSGWVATIGLVGGGTDPVWASFGIKASGSNNYSWQTPFAVNEDERFWDAVDQNGMIKPGVVDSDALQPNVATAQAVYSNSATWVVGSTGVWQNVVQGGVTAAVAVTMASGTGQGVQIMVVMRMNRAGGSDDTVQLRCQRDGVTILSQQYSIQIQDEDKTYAFMFVDTSPGAGVTRTYRLQINTNDNSNIYQTVMSAIALKR